MEQRRAKHVISYSEVSGFDSSPDDMINLHNFTRSFQENANFYIKTSYDRFMP